MITAIMSTYNEIDYLPLKIQWCKSNGIELYVCDNMSTDGTWEMLQANDIKSHQYDTGGMFSEVLMQREIRKTLDRIKPDWVLYMGCDMFFYLPKHTPPVLLNDEYNCISFNFISAKYTGEDRLLPFNPFRTFTHVMIHQRLKFLFKYQDGIKFNGDDILIPNENCHHANSIVINYGDTKLPIQRIESLKRKQRAWDAGIDNLGHGEHLREWAIGTQLYYKQDLINVKDSSRWYQIEQIAKDAGL